ncbi:hypothetical protein MRX96_028545 [Rhipicephalus microplus]
MHNEGEQRLMQPYNIPENDDNRDKLNYRINAPRLFAWPASDAPRSLCKQKSEERCGLVVSHHPSPFFARDLWTVAEAGEAAVHFNGRGGHEPAGLSACKRRVGINSSCLLRVFFISGATIGYRASGSRSELEATLRRRPGVDKLSSGLVRKAFGVE